MEGVEKCEGERRNVPSFPPRLSIGAAFMHSVYSVK